MYISSVVSRMHVQSKVQENNLEALKLQENQPVDVVVHPSIKKSTSISILFPRLLKIKVKYS